MMNNEMEIVFLEFSGIYYRVELPGYFMPRLVADYGAFMRPPWEVKVDYVISVRQGKTAAGNVATIGDSFVTSPGHMQFVCAGNDRRTWERSIRTYLSTHISAALFDSKGYIRLHGGLIAYNRKNILISGPSGAGKTSLCLAMSALPGAVYLGHEMIFATAQKEFLGWPQPFTLNPGTMAWFERSGIMQNTAMWIERSDVPDVKHRVGYHQNAFNPVLNQLDMVIFPRRTEKTGGDSLIQISSDLSFTKLTREVEYPITHGYSPIKDLQQYALEAIKVSATLSEVTAFKLAWHDDQSVSCRLIDMAIQAMVD